MKFKYVKDGVAHSNSKSLHEALGYKREALGLRYSSVAELEAALKGMNIIDMQAFAVELGIKPTSDRPRLKRAVVDQYKRVSKAYGGLVKKPKEVEEDDSFNPRDFEV